ncbi:bifunctional diguanylate cyclase/phosphodiesterase [Legionella quateirensis]|uniref:Inner membrane protein PLUS sensory box protein LssE n=1 Tax=Legionella quateirensis TaxID=45072 RepID=A0A378KXN5_9GAMM|nr:GGDEF domain-containing phosphodiesterase [Legionella quateirensis]KTD43374.1 inner membrane protein/sensory box protein LssE [Legionella quateirensis]STY18257.1 inner membrane protein PLUS sensory box protein LssE [Legionella quateirensis]
MEKIIISVKKCRTITKTLSLGVILIGCLGVSGWFFENQVLKSIFPNSISVKFNTAVCIVLIGFALYLVANRKSEQLNRYLSKSIALLVLVISLLTLYEYLFGIDLGIDQLIYVDKPVNPLYFSGRMAFCTAISFVFASLSVLCIDSRTLPVWSYQVFMCLILPLIMFSILYNIANVEPDYLIVTYINLAVHTIVAFILICAALLFVRPTVGVSSFLLADNVGGRLARILLPLFFIAAVIFIKLISLGVQYQLYGKSFTMIVANMLYLTMIYIVVFICILIMGKLEKRSNVLSERLKKREQLFTEFTENIDLVLWRMPVDSNELTYVSPAFEKICGQSVDSLYQAPDSWLNLVVPEDRVKILDAIEQIKNGVSNIIVEIKILRADGVIRQISDQIFPLKNNNGKVLAILGVATDVTAKYNLMMQHQLLAELHKNLSKTQDISIFSQNILKAICLAIGYEIGEFWLLDDNNTSLTCLAYWLKDDLVIKSKSIRTLSLTNEHEKTFQIMCLNQSTIQISTFPSDLEHPYQRMDGQPLQIKEVVGIPLVVSEQKIGLMNFYTRGELNLTIDVFKMLMEFTANFSKFIQNILLINKMKYIDNYDPLTGLYNRQSFLKKIEEFIEHKVQSFVVIKLQVNNIQLINNTLGYDVGNNIFQNLAKKYFDVSLSTVDMIAVLQPGVFGFLSHTLKNKNLIIDFVQKLLEITVKPIKENNLELFLTTNVGISQYPEHGVTANDLLGNAIWALIESTKDGSHQFKFATSETLTRPARQLEIESAMHEALLNNELELYYQPQISLTTGKITGVEALVRWNDPTGVLRLPDYFIPVCEQSTLILELSDWVLRAAFNDMARSECPIHTAINLTARQFGSSYNLVEKLKNLLAEFSINSRFLELEVTETLLMTNTVQTVKVINELQELGIHITLDDFGTGYSSFDYLKNYCPETLKIDKTFVDGLPDNANSIKIIKGIIALSHSLNITVVAEGVETAAQANFLLGMGCDAIQGFFFSKPLPFAEIQALIKMDKTFELPSKNRQ